MRILYGLLCIPLALFAEYHSQYGQDQYLYETYFKEKKSGCFVDIGAHDGVTFSNSFFFEKKLNWTGICVEPLPEIFNTLSQQRQCVCIQGCITNQSGTSMFLRVKKSPDTDPNYHLEMLSGLLAKYDPQHLDRINREVMAHKGSIELVPVPCFTLNEVLSKNNIVHVDFLSLDTEGGEFDILRSIDFDKVQIDIIVIEDNYNNNKIFSLMSKKGYRLDKRLASDLIFVHNGSLTKSSKRD